MFGGRVGVPELLLLMILLFIFGGAVAAAIAAWWRIFAKAGHPGALGLLMMIPGVNFVVLLWFAFSDWPIQKSPTLHA
jgi:hypothetical protein